MSWYDSAYRKRIPIAVSNPGGASTGDVDVLLPEDWDAFWDVIDTAGAYLRVTAADGRTLVSYDIDKPGGGAFSKAGRSGRIRIDGASLYGVADSVSVLWLYWDPDGTVTDASVVVTIASALDGVVEPGIPSGRLTVLQAHPPGLSRPQRLHSKSTTAREHYWIDVSDYLQTYAAPVEERTAYEEVSGLVVDVVDSSGTPEALCDASRIRVVETWRGRRRVWVRLELDGGTDDTSYTVRARLATATPGDTTHRVIDARLGLRSYDAVEPAV